MKLLNSLQHLGLSIGLEDIANGTKSREKEYAWYGKLVNPEKLEKAVSKEVQKQSTLKGKGGTIRVRETTSLGQVRYVLTAKHYQGFGDATEVSLPVTVDMYEVFKGLSGESMDKIRYTFPIEGSDLKWEVDVFIDSEGKAQEWVKIDLEVPEETTEFPPLPVELTEVIFGGNREYTPEEKAKLDKLFKEVFINKL